MKELKKLQAFTLVEMLVVMAILIILMGVGIAGGRYAMETANKTRHQNAADQIASALRSYYTDKREYPTTTTFGSFNTAVVSNTGILKPYFDSKFDAGSDAEFIYAVSSDKQKFLVCASYKGGTSAAGGDGYCEGDGFGTILTTLSGKDVSPWSTAKTACTAAGSAVCVTNTWTSSTKAFN